MCDRVSSEDPFLIVYCPNKYKTERMCDEAVDDPLASLQLIPDWFVLSKTNKILFITFYADENVLYFKEDSGNFVFSCNEVGIFDLDLNNINLDNSFDEDDPDTIILVRLLAWHIKSKTVRHLKNIDEELMSIAWHPKRR